MSATIPQLVNVLERMGSTVTYHREDGGTACPCLTFEGFRDPAWHRANPDATVCNEQGMLTEPVEFIVKAAVQGFKVRGKGGGAQGADPILFDIQSDDRFGIFPCEWNSQILDFYNWSEAGDDFILYDGRRYIVIAADKVPDIDGDPSHHWELHLRLVKMGRPS